MTRRQAGDVSSAPADTVLGKADMSGVLALENNIFLYTGLIIIVPACDGIVVGPICF